MPLTLFVNTYQYFVWNSIISFAQNRDFTAANWFQLSRRLMVNHLILFLRLYFSRCREALPYLVHACNLNSRLLHPNNASQAMNEQLLTHWRRECFLRLNELAVQMFDSSDWKSVCAGLELLSELVIPCIPKLSSSPQTADGQAVEQVRDGWCNFLASPLDGKKTQRYGYPEAEPH